MEIMALLLINFIIVMVWDVFSIPSQLSNAIVSKLSRGKITNVQLVPPFGCSLCMVFWTSLIYLLITSPISFMGILLIFTASLINAYCTTYVYMGINLVNKMALNIFISLDRLVDKIK